jgi:hypothetical protein
MSSALDALEEHRFHARGRDDAKLAGGPEFDLLQVIFSRMARWIASTGATPPVVTTSHRKLLRLVPELLGSDAAEEIPSTKRISDIALRWRAALEKGVRFLAAADDEEPRYWVHLHVRNANASLRFWFDVDRIGDDGHVQRLLTTARDQHQPLTTIVAETNVDPPFESWARRIRAAAQSGNQKAQRVLVALARVAVGCLVLLAISYVVYLLLPESAQAAVRRIGRRGWDTIQRWVAPSTTLDVIGREEEHDSGAHAQPIVVEETHLGPYLVANFEITPTMRLPTTGPGIEVTSNTPQYPEWVSIVAYPSPRFRSGKKTVEFSFSDGSTTKRREIGPPIWMANIGHEFKYVAPEDLGVGDISRPVTITMRVYSGIGHRKRLVEVVDRELYILVGPKALNYNPFAEEAQRENRSTR